MSQVEHVKQSSTNHVGFLHSHNFRHTSALNRNLEDVAICWKRECFEAVIMGDS